MSCFASRVLQAGYRSFGLVGFKETLGWPRSEDKKKGTRFDL